MAPEPEYVVAVKRWPAYTLGTLLPFVMVLYAVLVIFTATRTSTTGLLSIVAFIAVAVGSFAVVGLLVWSLLRLLTVIRHPPRLTAQGMRLWLIPTRDYVVVPWQRITAVRFATKGIGTALFIYVDHPDALAGGDPVRVRRIRRFARRYLGAPFVYPVSGARNRLEVIDNALRVYSDGRMALRRS